MIETHSGRPIDPDLSGLREAAVHVVKRLHEAGYVAYFAGGCVRDRLMGHEPTDYDVATSAKPQEVAKIFPRVQTVGESFGVMLVRIKDRHAHAHVIQVATFRTEGVYSDGRHPDHVQFSDAEHDASRRDFTINGLFENPLTDEIIDFVGGRIDLERRVVRAIGDPHARLREDRLRMLRAVRFAARFAFSLDPETADAIRTGAEHLQGISRERIGQELKRMLSHHNRGTAAWELQSLGLDEQVLKEPGQRTPLLRLSHLADETAYPTALAAWLLDRHGEDLAHNRTIANRWADELVLSNEEREALLQTLEVHSVLQTTWASLGVARQKRLASQACFSAAMEIVQAVDRELYVAVRNRHSDLAKTGIAPKPLIDGADLIASGLHPGPVFSRLLEAVYDAQLEGSISSKDQAIRLAGVLAVEQGATGR